MFNPPHPGEILKSMYLDPLGFNVTNTSVALGVTRQTLSELINGKIGVSPTMAMKLAKAFRTSPEMWLNMQTKYDLWQIRKINLRSVKCLVKPHKAA